MTIPELITFLIGILICAILIIYQNRKSKSVRYFKRLSTLHELNALNEMQPVITRYNWYVIIKSIRGYKSVYEENDIGNVGYHIYLNYKAAITEKQISVYIIDRLENRYLKIITDGSSESMIGVNHPLHGHIGYLSFEVIE